MSDEHFTARDRLRLRFAIFLTGTVFFVELIGGLWTGSLALVADSAHMFLDTFAVALSLAAMHLAERPASDRRTYGWHRAEVLAALINGLLLSVIAVEIFYHGWLRLKEPTEVLVAPMMIIAFVGLVVNVIVAFRLHDTDRHDINLRGAYLHVLGDLMASVAVLVGGAVMLFTGNMMIDAVLGMLIGGLVLFAALRLLKDAGHILLEGVPGHIKVDDVHTAIEDLPDVVSVHDIHVWAICSHILSMSCHVKLKDIKHEQHDGVIADINNMVKEKFLITHSTIQVDHNAGDDEPVITQDLDHRAVPEHSHEEHE